MATAQSRLAGRRVVITGVSRGVGFEVAKRFLAEGAEVLGVARSRANLARAGRALRAYGRAYTSLLADVALPTSAARVAAAVKRRWGALDLLLNNAAVNPGSAAFEADRDLEATLRVNVLGPHRMMKALLPLLRKGHYPRVVNVSSGAGDRHSIETGKDMSAYRLSKWSLNGLTRLWANELKGQVSVVGMDPGWVKTDMGGPQAPDSPTLSAQRALEIALLPPHVTGSYLCGAREGSW
ncbi:MAG: SDR family NAD(P)-dependent oxidoreductase [Candidatus Coatesbacteria bacterium]